MTKDEAIAKIKSLSPLTADDIIGLQNCTPDQVTAIVQNYIDADPRLNKPTIWQQIADVLKQVPDWAQAGITILQVLQKVFAV
jgi:hypothetical protein